MSCTSVESVSLTLRSIFNGNLILGSSSRHEVVARFLLSLKEISNFSLRSLVTLQSSRSDDWSTSVFRKPLQRTVSASGSESIARSLLRSAVDATGTKGRLKMTGPLFRSVLLLEVRLRLS